MADLNLLSLPPIEDINVIKKERKIAIYGDERWEDIRMDPKYHEYWKVVNYYVERSNRIIIMNGYISHSLNPKEIGTILWSEGGQSWDRLNPLRKISERKMSEYE